MPIIEMPDGQHVEFPDDMPKEQIRSMIASKFPDAVPAQNQPQAPKQETYLQGVQRVTAPAVQTGGRMIRDLLGGIAQSGLDVLAGLGEIMTGRPDEPKITLKSAQTGMGDVGRNLVGPMLLGGGASSAAGLATKGMGPLRQVLGGSASQFVPAYAQSLGQGQAPGDAALQGGFASLLASPFEALGATARFTPHQQALKEAHSIGEEAAKPGSDLRTPEEADVMLEQLKKRAISQDLDVGTLAQDPEAIERYHRMYARYAPKAEDFRARQRAFNQVYQDAFESLRGPYETQKEAMDAAVNHVKDWHKQIKAESKALYEPVQEIGESMGRFNEELPLGQKVIQKYDKQIKDVPDYIQEKINQFVRKEEMPSKILDEKGNPIRVEIKAKGATYNELNKFIKDLRDLADYTKDGDRLNDFYKDMSAALKRDLKNNAQKAGNTDFIEALNKADQHYIENQKFVQDNPALHRLIHEKEPDIKDFNAIFRNENASKLNFVKKLPKEAQDAARFFHFMRDLKRDIEPNDKIYKEAQPYSLIRHYKNMPSELKNLYYGPKGEAEMKFLEDMAILNARSAAEVSSIRTGEQTAKQIMDLRQKFIPTSPEKILEKASIAAQKGYYKRKMKGLKTPEAREAFKKGFSGEDLRDSIYSQIFRGASGTPYGTLKYLMQGEDK